MHRIDVNRLIAFVQLSPSQVLMAALILMTLGVKATALLDVNSIVAVRGCWPLSQALMAALLLTTPPIFPTLLSGFLPESRYLLSQYCSFWLLTCQFAHVVGIAGFDIEGDPSF